MQNNLILCHRFYFNWIIFSFYTTVLFFIPFRTIITFYKSVNYTTIIIILLLILSSYLLSIITNYIIKKLNSKIFINFIFSLNIFFFVQSSFIILFYPSIDGNLYNLSNLNYIAYLEILLVFFIFGINFLSKINIKKISIILFGTQLLYCFFIIPYAINKNFDNFFRDAYFDTLPENKLSNNKNILIFIVDTLQSTSVLELTASNDFKKSFLGFDFYPDTLSQYPYTRFSIPSFLTGIRYLNQSPYYEYIDKSYNSNSSILKNALIEDCEVNLFRWGMATPIPQNPLLYSNISKADLFNFHNLHNLKLYIIYELMIISPHFMKKYLYNIIFNENIINNQDLDIFQFNNNGSEPIFTNGCILKIVHLKGLHIPILDVDGNPSFDNSAYLSTAIKELSAISSYLDNYKKYNVYDNTAVIIAGDHGAGLQRFDLNFPSIKNSHFTAKSSMQQSAMPALMVKPFNSKNNPLIVNYDKNELQNINCIVNRFILSSYKSRYCDESVFSKERSFYYSKNADLILSGYAMDFTEFLVTDNVYLDSSWIYSNKVYSATPIARGGKVDVKLSNNYPLNFFSSNGYLVFGWGAPQDGFTWTSGKRSRLAIPVSSSADLILEATISPFVIPGKVEKQDVDIFIGPTKVGSWSISAPGVYKVVIPQVLLKGGVLDVSFDLLNATSAKKLGIGPDPEILALQFGAIKVSEVGYQLRK
jgi:hypothetical protein